MFTFQLENNTVKGTAVYTTTFTPSNYILTATQSANVNGNPSAAIASGTGLLTLNTNRFNDSSTINATITIGGTPKIQAFTPLNPTTSYSVATNGGSAYFNGTSDYLTLPDSTNWDLGANDFTIECWIYLTSMPAGATGTIVGQWKVTIGRSFILYVGGGILSFVVNTSTTLNTPASSIAINQWTHVAVVRNGATWQIYLNGISRASASAATIGTSTSLLAIGFNLDGAPATYFFPGYISNFRICKGFAAYTGAFTPPLSPVSTVNSFLKLDFANAGIIDSAGKNVVQTVADAESTNTKIKFTSSSMYFDGTGDYVFSAANQNYVLGTKNFTIECWFTPNAISLFQPVFGIGSVSVTGIAIQQRSDNGFNIVWGNGVSGGASFVATTGITIAVGTWYHLALVRNGSSVVLYVDGTSRASMTPPASFGAGVWNLYVGQGFVISSTNLALSSSPLNGYISDFRLTNGIARYTSSPFTPPTAAFSLN